MKLKQLTYGLLGFLLGVTSLANAGDATSYGSTVAIALPSGVEGAACSGVGKTAFTATGMLLSCDSGVWRIGGGAFGDPNAGWTELPNGLIMNWGNTAVLASDARVNITLPRPCRSTLPSVSTSTNRDTSDSASTTHVVPAVGLDYFQLRISGSAQSVRWTALCS